MGALAFLQPLMLYGLAAIVLPPLIHLIHRRRRRKAPIATLRFLRESDRRSAQRYRLLDLLALLARMALLALIALALAQPFWRPAAAADAPAGPASVALVLDDSMSMQWSEQGRARFDRAVAAAAQLLNALPAESEACVFLSSGRTPPALAVPASPPSSIVELLDGLQCSSGGRPLAVAVNQAVGTLAAGKHRNRVLIVLSDMQAAALRDGGVDADRLASEVQRVMAIDIAAGEAEAVNAALAWGRVEPSVGWLGMPMRFEAGVWCEGGEARTATISLWLDDRQVEQRTIDLLPGVETAVAFDHTMTRPGAMRATLRIDGDAFPADNTWRETLRVPEPMAVLVLGPGEAAGAGGEAERYLVSALDPLRARNLSGAAPVLVDRHSYASVLTPQLERYPAILLVDAPSMPVRLREALDGWVRAGGRLIAFPGEGASGDLPEPALFADGKYQGLPIAGLWRREAGGDSLEAGDYEREHPVFAMLARAVPELFYTLGFDALLSIDESALGPNDRVIARYQDGRPWLVERAEGAGTRLIWTSGVGPRWGNLALQPLFVPLLFESLKQAGAGALPRGNVDGGFRWDVPPAASGRSWRIALDGERQWLATVPEGMDRLDFEEAAWPGFYAIAPAEGEAPPVVAAVNRIPEEAPLTRAGDAALAAYWPVELWSGGPATADEAASALAEAGRGRPLGGWLMLAALAAFLFETYLSNALLRAREERPAWLTRAQRRLEGNA
jgi:hypothetical protein